MLDIHAVSYQLVLTKADKISQTERDAVLEQVKQESGSHPALYPDVLLTSAEKRLGIDDLQLELYKVAIT